MAQGAQAPRQRAGLRPAGPVDERDRRLTLELDTPHGPARAHLHPASEPTGALVLGHGAGGGVGAQDLVAATRTAVACGLSVALVEQPYRVAGRRAPAPARQLDAAWEAVLDQLRVDALRGLDDVIVGGRSSGARVACRTAAAVGARGVVCLAFPLNPPGAAGDPAKSRLGELDAVSVPVLVVQGERDPFGLPGEAPGRLVVEVPGTHALRAAGPVADAVAAWLAAR